MKINDLDLKEKIGTVKLGKGRKDAEQIATSVLIDRLTGLIGILIIGGFGDGRGDSLINKAKIYGYKWDNSTNEILRWGTNKIKIASGYSIEADFDGLGEGDATIYEGTIADHDSGSGWFIKDGSVWKLAGVTHSVDIHFEAGHEGDPNYLLYEAWFRNRAFPTLLAPDELYGLRISSYLTWINGTIPAVIAGDLSGDDYVDIRDFSVFAGLWGRSDCSEENNWCRMADSDNSGQVGWEDLITLSENWLTN